VTILFAVLAVIAAVIAIQAKSDDSKAQPAAVPAPAPAATTPAATAPPAATAQPAHRAASRPVERGRRARTRTHRRPAFRFTLPSNRALAAQDCREESFDDAAEFRFTYGSGAAAIRRCARFELSKARAECRADQLEDPYDYRAEHGTGSQGLARCVRDSLT
jgi:hypothetical protein